MYKKYKGKWVVVKRGQTLGHPFGYILVLFVQSETKNQITGTEVKKIVEESGVCIYTAQKFQVCRVIKEEEVKDIRALAKNLRRSFSYEVNKLTNSCHKQLNELAYGTD